MVHAVGDGTFVVDGRKLDRKKMMASKLPPDSSCRLGAPAIPTECLGTMMKEQPPRRRVRQSGPSSAINDSPGSLGKCFAGLRQRADDGDAACTFNKIASCVHFRPHRSLAKS